MRLDPYQEEEKTCGADARRWETEDVLSYGFSEMSWEQRRGERERMHRRPLEGPVRNSKF